MRTPQQLKESYENDGYVFPIEAVPAARAAEYRAMLESAEAAHADDALASRLLVGFSSIVVPFVDQIMRLPSVIEPVKAVLGDDLLVMGANFFIKEAGSPAFVSWHQDLTYWGYNDTREVTAWVALTAATKENGCMRFMPGSHRHQIVDHRDTFDTTNMLSRGQEVAVDVDEADAVDVTLRPGEMSLHHGHMFHASSPNTSTDRRLGLVLRYVAPSMRQESGTATFAHLVAGEDRYGHFNLLQPADGLMAPGDVENAQQAFALQEQIGYAGAADQGRRTT